VRPKGSAIQDESGRDCTPIKVPIALKFAEERGALTLAMSGPFLPSSQYVPKPRNRTSSLLRSMTASGTRRHGAAHPDASHIECPCEAEVAQWLKESRTSADETGSARLSGSGCLVVTHCGKEHFCCLSVRARTSRRKANRRANARRLRLVRYDLGACSWSMRRRHSSHSWLTSAARTAVKGALLLRVHRSEAQTLDGRRSEGYARSASQSRFRSVLCFQHS
jgi:hypothetical protein